MCYIPRDEYYYYILVYDLGIVLGLNIHIIIQYIYIYIGPKLSETTDKCVQLTIEQLLFLPTC